MALSTLNYVVYGDVTHAIFLSLENLIVPVKLTS